tara:strand:+ start:2006 stop:2386 length:381 start_codon:yes stop_codon:yes gene_type:complete
MDYEYKDLELEGYTKFSISKRDQNKIFRHRKAKVLISYEYYVKGPHIVLQAMPNVAGCIVSTILLPIGILLEGVRNYKEVYRDMVLKTWQCKKYGAFSSDDMYRGRGDVYEKVLDAATNIKVRNQT